VRRVTRTSVPQESLRRPKALAPTNRFTPSLLPDADIFLRIGFSEFFPSPWTVPRSVVTVRPCPISSVADSPFFLYVTFPMR